MFYRCCYRLGEGARWLRFGITLLAAGDQVGGALGDGEDRGVQGGIGDDRHHRRVGDPQPADAVDPQLRVGDRAAAGSGPIAQVPAGW